jgi:hypothetical protein
MRLCLINLLFGLVSRRSYLLKKKNLYTDRTGLLYLDQPMNDPTPRPVPSDGDRGQSRQRFHSFPFPRSVLHAQSYRTEEKRPIPPSIRFGVVFHHSVVAREGHGQAVDRQREGAELHAALGRGRGPPVLGGEVVEEDEHLQLGELVAGARVGPVPERHERVGLGSHLQA